MIEAYYHQDTPAAIIAEPLNHSKQPICNIINFLKLGHIALDYSQQDKKNKQRCGRKKIFLQQEEHDYIEDKVAQGWTPDVLVG